MSLTLISEPGRLSALAARGSVTSASLLQVGRGAVPKGHCWQPQALHPAPAPHTWILPGSTGAQSLWDTGSLSLL